MKSENLKERILNLKTKDGIFLLECIHLSGVKGGCGQLQSCTDYVSCDGKKYKSSGSTTIEPTIKTLTLF